MSSSLVTITLNIQTQCNEFQNNYFIPNMILSHLLKCLLLFIDVNEYN